MGHLAFDPSLNPVQTALRQLPLLICRRCCCCHCSCCFIYVFLALLNVFYYHTFSRQLSAFSLCFFLSLPLLVLSTIELSVKVSLSPDIIVCGWLGWKHRLTRCFCRFRRCCHCRCYSYCCYCWRCYCRCYSCCRCWCRCCCLWRCFSSGNPRFTLWLVKVVHTWHQRPDLFLDSITSLALSQSTRKFLCWLASDNFTLTHPKKAFTRSGKNICAPSRPGSDIWRVLALKQLQCCSGRWGSFVPL